MPLNMETILLEKPLIVGAGLAALTVALQSSIPVAVLSDQKLGVGGSTVWAQGGIAAALGKGDSPELHMCDTIQVGGELSKPDAARWLADGAKEAIHFLAKLGVPFDRDATQELALGLEGAHSKRRIVKIKGDQMGPVLMHHLVKAVHAHSHIALFECMTAFELYTQDGRIAGLWAHVTGDPSKVFLFLAPMVILCTGGIGHLYSYTTNPPQACGDGLAMAMRAGAVVENIEFVQFHPTALACDRDPLPLLTEALRGEGAHLVNNLAERFMRNLGGELAPRDVIARTIALQHQAGFQTFLDARPIDDLAHKFPLIVQVCHQLGLEPTRDLLPIMPAAHYHMGGIRVERTGRASVPGLWACGEVASTGVHGANRLASNSLLEAVVYGTFLARSILDEPLRVPISCHILPSLKPNLLDTGLEKRLRHAMHIHVGVIRSREGLMDMLDLLEEIQETHAPAYPLTHRLQVMRAITQAALARDHSLGSHCRAEDLAPLSGMC